MFGRNNMKMNFLVCVLWCLTLNASAGQLTGDPAPGRSPGPPSSNATAANAIWPKNYDEETHQVPRNENRKVTTVSKPIKQRDKLVDKLTYEFVNRKPCKNLSVNEYLLMKKHSPNVVKVVRSSLSAGAVTKNHKISPPSSVGIDVIHNGFDLNYGLVRNVIYTGNNCFGIFNYAISHFITTLAISDLNEIIEKHSRSLCCSCCQPIISRMFFYYF